LASEITRKPWLPLKVNEQELCRTTHMSEAASIKLLLLPWLCILQRLYITILCSRLVLLCCSSIPQQMPAPERIISIRAHEPNLLHWNWTNLLRIDHNT
jgi:hypothetical protein